jgi:hypothetical protein
VATSTRLIHLCSAVLVSSSGDIRQGIVRGGLGRTRQLELALCSPVNRTLRLSVMSLAHCWLTPGSFSARQCTARLSCVCQPAMHTWHAMYSEFIGIHMIACHHVLQLHTCPYTVVNLLACMLAVCPNTWHACLHTQPSLIHGTLTCIHNQPSLIHGTQGCRTQKVVSRLCLQGRELVHQQLPSQPGTLCT